MSYEKGFTLIELIITLILLGILSMYAVNSITNYASSLRTNNAKLVLGEINSEINRYSLINLKTEGFSLLADTITNKDGKVEYSLYLYDLKSFSAKKKLSSNDWAIKAIPKNLNDGTLLMNSSGIQCLNKNKDKVTNTGCGTIAEGKQEW